MVANWYLAQCIGVPQDGTDRTTWSFEIIDKNGPRDGTGVGCKNDVLKEKAKTVAIRTGENNMIKVDFAARDPTVTDVGNATSTSGSELQGTAPAA